MLSQIEVPQNAKCLYEKQMLGASLKQSNTLHKYRTTPIEKTRCLLKLLIHITTLPKRQMPNTFPIP